MYEARMLQEMILVLVEYIKSQKLSTAFTYYYHLLLVPASFSLIHFF